MKNIAVLGSTGSIGTQTLEVVRRNPGLFHIAVLAANSSDELFERSWLADGRPLLRRRPLIPWTR